MSGGSLDYIYSRVDDAANTVDERATTSLHRAFADHLRLVARALHDIEWLFSGDYGDGQEIEAIRKVITPNQEIETVTRAANKTLEELKSVLKSIPPSPKERS